MDDTLGFEESSKKSSTEWQLGVQSNISLAASSNTQPIHQDLYVIPQNEENSLRPTIDASWIENLSFYRCYTSTVSKIELLCMQQNSVNRFFWFYIFNVLCKSLPMAYVHIFLSTYAPDHHFFLPKMVPICYGLNVIFVITGIFEIFVLLNNTSLYILFIVAGLMNKMPWNRCLNTTMEFDGGIFTCYNLSEFAKKVRDTNITYEGYYYATSSKENISFAQIEYFDYFLNTVTEGQHHQQFILMAAMWIFVGLSYNYLFKNLVWKVLHYTHLALISMFIMIFIHLVIVYEDSEIQIVETHDEDHRRYLMNADFDLLAESMTAPPIAHIVSARSTTEIKPSRNSAIIITSNAAYYLFRALTTYLMKKYCENHIKATIIYWNYGSGSIFYFWPMYFATLYLGDFFVIIFFALNGIVDSCTFFSENSFIFWTATSTLAEVIVLFWVYPMGRLIDDITFHYGMFPTKLRVWSFMIVPVFYLIKTYVIISRFNIVRNENDNFRSQHNTRSTFLYQLILFSVFAMYAFYHITIKQNKSWTFLFKPAPEWGPKDFNSRQLRKQFDTREYIGSQAPRPLSRFLISKAELKSYKLDIPYEPVIRRTEVQNENEKL
nr:uncharacterized protein LOC113392724 [Vanessa tameamea]